MEIWTELGSPTIVTSSCIKVWIILALDLVRLVHFTKVPGSWTGYLQTHFQDWVSQPWVMALMRRLTAVCLSAAGRSHRVNRQSKHPDKKPRHHAGQYTIVTPTVGDEETQWPILSLPGVKQTCKQCLTMFGKVEYEFHLLLIFPNIAILIWWRWPQVDLIDENYSENRWKFWGKAFGQFPGLA